MLSHRELLTPHGAFLYLCMLTDFMIRVGDHRLRVPEPAAPYTGTHNATEYGSMCPNQFPVLQPSRFLAKLADGVSQKVWTHLYDGDEDCG